MFWEGRASHRHSAGRPTAPTRTLQPPLIGPVKPFGPRHAPFRRIVLWVFRQFCSLRHGVAPLDGEDWRRMTMAKLARKTGARGRTRQAADDNEVVVDMPANRHRPRSATESCVPHQQCRLLLMAGSSRRRAGPGPGSGRSPVAFCHFSSQFILHLLQQHAASHVGETLFLLCTWPLAARLGRPGPPAVAARPWLNNSTVRLLDCGMLGTATSPNLRLHLSF
jgi:hypothetical protein